MTPKAGFCRGCGSILSGKAATATVVVATASPPVSDHGAETAAPVPVPGYAAGPRVGQDDRRMAAGMLAFDGTVLAGSAIILFSAIFAWYERHVVVYGVGHTLTRQLLSGDAGIQRSLVLVVAAVIFLEVVLNMFSLIRSRRVWRAHRAAVLALCLFELILVGSCILSSPLGVNKLSNLGISLNPGPGGWIALCGAGIALLGALGRMFAGRPMLGRSTPGHSRLGGAAIS